MDAARRYLRAFLTLVPLAGLPAVAAADFGRLAIVGDSITQGGRTPSYRHPFWKHLVDNGHASGVDYTLVGSQTGFFTGGSSTATVPTYRGETFANVHEGHWGWRASWMNASVALPASRYNVNNLGQGTVANWTGQSAQFATANAGTLAYTGTTYVPDTVVVTIGINDLGDGASAADVEGRIQSMVQQYQAANAAVRVYVAGALPVSASHASAASINPKVTTLNASLATTASAWSAGSSTVSYIDLRPGFDATTMTYDNTHPNHAGERVIAANLATALGIGGRDLTLGLGTATAANLTGQFNDFNALPGTTASGTFYRAGTTTTWTDPTPGDSLISFASAQNQAAYLQANWNLGSLAPMTVDLRLKMVSNGRSDNNFVIWTDDGAGGAAAGFLRIFTDRLEWGYATGDTRLTIDVGDNTSAFHDYRMVFDGSRYAVWRDDALVADGLPGDSTTTAGNRLILGDYSTTTTAGLAISSSAILDSAAFQTGAALAIVPEPGGMFLAVAGLAAVGAAGRCRTRRQPAVHCRRASYATIAAQLARLRLRT